ncbi:MAG: hypothetical protein LBP55_03525 [Candidatus Adiutrix sp.]|nr:hypothetical protein [Candidatus Adiutrix sp.]
MNTAINQQVTAADVAGAAGWDFSTSAQQWIRDHPAKDIAGAVDDEWPNPWTGLGYTYDWNPDNPTHQGLTEFIAPGDNTSATVSGVASLGSYLYAQRDSAGAYADELNGNFKIWGTADTVWGKRDYFRKLYYTGDSSSVIDLTPTGRLEKGVLIEDASYTVRNAGLITAREGRLPADSRNSSSEIGHTSNVFFINHTGAAYGGSSTDLTVNVENSGAIGHDGLGSAYTFESAAASGQATSLNINNTGALYAGSRGLILTGGAGAETVNIDNHGWLYSGPESHTFGPTGGDDISLRQHNNSVYVSRGAMAINGRVDFQDGSLFFLDLTRVNNPLLMAKEANITGGAVFEGHMPGQRGPAGIAAYQRSHSDQRRHPGQPPAGSDPAPHLRPEWGRRISVRQL